MRSLMLTLHLLIMGMFIGVQTTPNGLPFSVECTDATTATLTISKDYILAGINGCRPKTGAENNTFTNYDLDTDCLTNGTFLVEHLTVGKRLVLAEDSHLFKVECEDDGGIIVYVNSSMSVDGLIGVPSVETFTSKPLPTPPELMLFLVGVDPSTTNGGLGDFQHNQLGTAHLGQTVYLALFADEALRRSQVLNLLPLSCEASTDGVEPITLWQLHNSSDSDNCFFEKSVMMTPFALGVSTTTVHHFSVAEVQAFRFTDNQDGLITFSCQVRVCRANVGLCLEERNSLESCGKGDISSTPTSPVPTAAATTAANPIRRRRDVEADSLLEGELHHVTATLRVTGDVFVHDGSSSIHYAMSSLLVVALSMVLI